MHPPPGHPDRSCAPSYVAWAAWDARAPSSCDARAAPACCGRQGPVSGCDKAGAGASGAHMSPTHLGMMDDPQVVAQTHAVTTALCMRSMDTVGPVALLPACRPMSPPCLCMCRMGTVRPVVLMSLHVPHGLLLLPSAAACCPMPHIRTCSAPDRLTLLPPLLVHPHAAPPPPCSHRVQPPGGAGAPS